jgi:hypothetical protein
MFQQIITLFLISVKLKLAMVNLISLTSFTAWLNPFCDDVNTLALLESAIIKENVDVLVTSQISAEAASKISTAGINLVTKNGGTVFDLIDEVRGE